MISTGVIGHGYWGRNLARMVAAAWARRLQTIPANRPERLTTTEQHPGIRRAAA